MKIRATIMIVAVALSVGWLSGCAQSPPSETIAQVYRDQMNSVMNDLETSDYVRQVLADYRVTDAEYQETRDLFKQCMADRGWTVTLLSPGYSVAPAPGGPQDVPGSDPYDDDYACTTELSDIEPIYRAMINNPKGLTWAEQVRDCFKAHDVPDGADLSDDQFDELVSDVDFHASTPEGKLCYHDPDGSRGITLESIPADGIPGRYENTGG